MSCERNSSEEHLSSNFPRNCSAYSNARSGAENAKIGTEDLENPIRYNIIIKSQKSDDSPQT
jgi:hypothetical protein